jgi:hypothetical protein
VKTKERAKQNEVKNRKDNQKVQHWRQEEARESNDIHGGRRKHVINHIKEQS